MADIDLEVLDQLAADITLADLRAVLGAFETDMQRLSAVMAAAADAADAEAYRRAAHSIAGAAGSVGATDLEQAARQAMRVSGADRVEAPAAARRVAGLVQGAVSGLRGFLAGKSDKATGS